MLTHFRAFFLTLSISISMARIGSIEVSPALINSSCAWASDLSQLQELYDCPYTGAVTTRTSTLGGFPENSSHTVRCHVCVTQSYPPNIVPPRSPSCQAQPAPSTLMAIPPIHFRPIWNGPRSFWLQNHLHHHLESPSFSA